MDRRPNRSGLDWWNHCLPELWDCMDSAWAELPRTPHGLCSAAITPMDWVLPHLFPDLPLGPDPKRWGSRCRSCAGPAPRGDPRRCIEECPMHRPRRAKMKPGGGGIGGMERMMWVNSFPFFVGQLSSKSCSVLLQRARTKGTLTW